MKKLYLLLLITTLIKADRQALAPCISNIFYNLPTLKTDRFILRKVQPEDLEDLHEIYSNPDVVRYVACELDSSIDDTQKWLLWRLNNAQEGKPVPWAVVVKSTNEMIGLAGLCGLNYKDSSGNLMILIKQSHWNKGYATEVLKKIVEFIFLSMGLNRVESLIHPDNIPSIILHEKLGFTCIGIIPEYKYYRGYYCDRLVFSLLKDQYIKI